MICFFFVCFFNSHFAVKDDLKIKNEKKGKIKREALGCHFCGKTFHGRYNLNRHLRFLHPS